MGVPEPSGADDHAVAIAIERHGGDAWAAIRALLQQNEYLENELAAAWALVSPGYARTGRSAEH